MRDAKGEYIWENDDPLFLVLLEIMRGLPLPSDVMIYYVNSVTKNLIRDKTDGGGQYLFGLQLMGDERLPDYAIELRSGKQKSIGYL